MGRERVCDVAIGCAVMVLGGCINSGDAQTRGSPTPQRHQSIVCLYWLRSIGLRMVLSWDAAGLRTPIIACGPRCVRSRHQERLRRTLLAETGARRARRDVVTVAAFYAGAD
jgi:hypothetical protein